MEDIKKLKQIKELIAIDMKPIDIIMKPHLNKISNNKLDEVFMLEAEAMVSSFDRLISDILEIINDTEYSKTTLIEYMKRFKQ